jgi:hypothetical protein
MPNVRPPNVPAANMPGLLVRIKRLEYGLH